MILCGIKFIQLNKRITALEMTIKELQEKIKE